MKKVIPLIIIICLMVSVFCITAMAAETKGADVLVVSGQDNEGKLEKIASYDDFEAGWNYAMGLAIDEEYLNNENYTRIVVDLLADWKAINGEFSDDIINGKGFNWDAIYFYDNARITLNMNGHTIDRGLTEYEYNGEVMYVSNGADVIINGGKEGDPIVKLGENPGDIQLGTITGGFSCNGAGGIHINDDANVVLNNVIIKGNSVEDDQGIGIAVHDDANLIMNGGKIVGNKGYRGVLGGGIYVDDASATLNDVLISDNIITHDYVGRGIVCSGAAAYVTFGNLTLNNCTIKNNSSPRFGGAIGILIGNVEMNNCIVTGNSAGIDGSAIHLDVGSCKVNDSDITGNVNTNYDSVIFAESGDIILNNTKYDPYIRKFSAGEVYINNTASGQEHTASIFGEGFVATILSILAIIIAAADIGVTIYYCKKKAVPTDDNTAE